MLTTSQRSQLDDTFHVYVVLQLTTNVHLKTHRESRYESFSIVPAAIDDGVERITVEERENQCYNSKRNQKPTG